MSDSDVPTAREVLIALNAHIVGCTFWNKIQVGFMGAILMCLVVFAGYTYSSANSLAGQLALARAQQAQSIAQVPAETVKRLTTGQ